VVVCKARSIGDDTTLTYIIALYTKLTLYYAAVVLRLLTFNWSSVICV